MPFGDRLTYFLIPRPIPPFLNKQQSLELLLILLTPLICVAQAETQSMPSPEPGTGLEGSISLHGISGGPVKQGVPDSKPLANTEFVVVKENSTVASFKTDDQGRFRISLPSGHYTISRKDYKAKIGGYGPFEVDVAAGQMKTVQWSCDSGIR